AKVIFYFYAKESEAVTGVDNDVLWMTVVIFGEAAGGRKNDATKYLMRFGYTATGGSVSGRYLYHRGR
ncbi:hypothetical protein ACFERN_005201, partial [Salmonella enterica]